MRQPADALLLSGLAVVAALLLTLLAMALQPMIAANQRAARERTMLEVMPAPRAGLALDAQPVPAQYRALLGLTGSGELYRVRRDGALIGLIVPVIAQGYGGPISAMVGIDLQGVVTGVRVLAHRETPGLGDDIELGKSTWILGFNGTSLGAPAENAWRVKKDGGHFEGLTGATVTPRAVVRQVHSALRYFAEDGRQRLLAAPQPQDRASEADDD